MNIFVNGKAIKSNGFDENKMDDTIYFLNIDELKLSKNDAIPNIQTVRREIHHSIGSIHFESRDDYDIISVKIPDSPNLIEPTQAIFCFLKQNQGIVIYESESIIDPLMKQVRENKLLSSDIPYLFFAILLRGDMGMLEDIEEEIAEIEDLIAESVAKSIPKLISKLRYSLLHLKKYYELIFALLEDMEENVNGLFGERQLKSIHIQTNKAKRLLDAVHNLRDYVTQVRESYQAQMDLQLNSIMKVITVVTSIFLPLSLIAGWYGMNIKMPEIALPFMYPVIIILSVIVIVLCILYFKYKKWF